MTLPKTGRRKSGDKAWLTSQSRRLRPSYRPVLESLEERVVPTTLSIPTNLTGARGSIVTVPINVDVLQDQATGFAGFGYGDFVLAYNSSIFTVANTDVHLGSVDPQALGFSVQTSTQNQGLVLVGVTGSAGQPSTAGGSVVTVDFHVKATAPLGPTAINLRATSPIGSTPTHIGDPSINDYNLTPPPQDAEGDPTDGLVTIGVFNHAPLAANDSYTVTEREAADAANLVISSPGVLANDTDQDGDALSAVKLSDPAHGTISFQSNGSFTYSSAAGYVGSDSFTYVAFDGADSSNTVTVALSVTPRLSIPTDLTAIAGGTVVVPVNINDAFPPGSGGLTGVTLAINYDPTVFTVATPDVGLGTATNKTNAIQTISFGGTVTGGSFTLVLTNGGATATTTAITYSSSQAVLQGTIQTALNGLSNMITGSAVVGTGPANSFTVTFQGASVSGRNIATMTANSSLTGTNPSVTVATTTNGFAAWVLGSTINQGFGKMGISLTGQSGINANPGGGSLVLITFHVNANAPPGPSPINLMATNVPSATSVTTRLDGQSGQLALRPFVTDGLDSFVDGIVTVGASATHFSITGTPSSTTAGGFANFTVTALDGANNSVSGYAGTVHFSSSDALAGLPANATLTSGAGTFSVTLKTAGNQTVTASDVATSSINGSSGTIAVVAAQATHFTVTASPVSTTVGGSTAVTVTALDSFNNTATGYSGTVHFASTDSVAALPADSTLTSGAGIFSITLKTFGSNTVSATDSVNSTLTATSNAVIVAGPPATHFSLTASPPVVTAGGAISITVTALDAGNNPTNGYLGTIHFASDDPIAGLPANATLTSGAGTFSVTLKTAGSRTLTATDTVATAITATSNSITVIAGAATHFAVVAPNTATAGNAFSFTVTAQDAFNNTAAGYNGTVKITATDTQIAQPVIVVLTAGTGTFSATLRTAGSQSLTGTDSVTSTLSGISNAIVVTPVAATRIISNGPISGLANNPFNVVVTALDPYNNTATSYQGTIHFTTSDSQGVLPTDHTLTNGQGTFTLTLKTLGAQTVTAADTVASSFSNTFTYTVFNDNTVGHFSVTLSPSGVTAGGTVSLTVTALDGFAQIVTGFTGTVHFTSTDGQALLPADATLTSGVGTFTAILNSPGNQTVMAATTTPIGVFPADKILVHKQGQTPFQIPLTNDSLMSRLDPTPGPTPGSYYIGIDDDHTSTGSFDNDILILVQPMPDGSLNLTTVHKEADVGGQHIYDLLNSAGTTLVSDFEPGPNQLYTLPPAFISGTSAAIQVGPAPFHYVLSAPANVIAGAAFSFNVTAFDASNNTLTGYNGTVHFSSTDGQATLPANATLTSGLGTFFVTLKTAGSRTLTATDTSSSSITASSNSISVNAAAANHFAVNGSPATVTTGGTVNFTVTALDQFNNTATAYNGTVGFTSTDSAATLPANSTLTSGAGAFSVTLKTAGNRTLTVTDAATSAIVGASNTIIVATPAATHFVVTTPVLVSAGASFAFTVTALDASNNTVPGYIGTIKFTSTDSAATMPANATLTSGSGTFTLTLKTAGNRTLTATDAANSSIAGTSNSITVVPGAATHFALSAPASAISGAAFNFTVNALDANNNTATGYGGSVRFSSSDGQAVLPANATLTSGTGTYNVTLKTTGNQTLTATDINSSTVTGTSGNIAVGSVGTAEIHGTVYNDVNRNGVRDTGLQNYVVNGNFSAGNTGFQTDYQFSSTDVSPEGNYTVGDTPNHFPGPNAANFGDHTTGTGLMMIVNGSSSATKVVWQETIAVPANTHFTFSSFAASWYSTSPANLKFVINGQQIGANFLLPTVVGQFQQFSSSWDSQSNTTATISIFDLQTAPSGNDFVLDDISFTGTPPSEPGLPGWVMYLDQNTNNTRDQSEPFTTTDSQGGYAFTGLAAGSYVVAQEGQTGWAPTNPATGRQTVSLTNGQILTGADFGDTTVATHFVISGAPATISPNSPFNFTITALDQFNNTATNYTGTVHFSSSDSLAVLPANATLTSGGGTYSVTLKTAGNQTVAATDTVAAGITGTSSAINVSAGPTTQITLASSANPSVYGQAVTVTATVSSAPANSPGLGAFYYNLSVTPGAVLSAFQLPSGTPVTGATLVAKRIDAQVNVPNNGGGFLPTTPVSGLGTSSVAAEWSGFVKITTAGSYTFYSPSDDGSLLYIDGSLVVNNDNTHGYIDGTSTPITLSAGLHTFLELFVQGNGGGGVEADYLGPDTSNARTIIPASVFFHGPTGIVTFFDGGTAIGSGFLSTTGSTTTATYATLTMSGGSHMITASYAGDGYFSPSSTATAVNQVVNTAPTATAVAASPNPSAVGEAVNLTATVSPSGGSGSQPSLTATYYNLSSVPTGISDAFAIPSGTPTANATLFVTRPETQINAPNNNNGYVPATPVAGLAVGQLGIKWSGFVRINQGGSYTFFSPSDDGSLLYIDGTQVVSNDGIHGYQDGTSTPITLTAGVHAFLDLYIQGAGAGGIEVDYQGPDTGGSRQIIPATAFASTLTGSVQFVVDGANYGSPVALSAGVASIGDSSLSLGTHAITAIYIGNSNFLTSNNNATPYSQTVVQPHFAINAPPVANVGAPYSFTVTALSPSNATATAYNGTVRFTSSDGQAVLPANATLTNGVGTFLATFKTLGNQTLTATDTVASSVTTTSGSILVANAATHFAISAPANATIGSAINVTVNALDANNNPAVAYNGNVTFSSTDAAAILPPKNAPGYFLVTDEFLGGHVLEYSATGALIQNIAFTPGPDSGPRSATIDGNGNIEIYEGTFSPTLTTIDPATGAVLHRLSIPGWSTINNVTYGGISAYGKYVFVTDMSTGSGGGANGLIRININDYSYIRFSTGDYSDLNVGRDGLFYANAGYNGITNSVQVYNPETLAFIRQVELSGGFGSIAIDQNGDIYAGGARNNNIYQFNSNGTLIRTVNVGTGVDKIDIDWAGRIVMENGNSMTVSDRSLTSFKTFPVASSGVGNTFVHWVQSAPGVPITLTNGVGTFTATLNTTGLQTITATDAANSTSTGTSNIIAVSNPATHLVVSAPASATAGASFTVTVTALDQANNTAIGYVGSVRFSSSDGLALLPANATLTNGVGTFNVTLKTAGSQSLVISEAVSTTITGAAKIITVSAASPSRFAIGAPAFATSGNAFNVTVTAFDPFNNTATGYLGSVHFSSSDAAAFLPADGTLTGGVGTFSATLKTAASQTLTATDAANTSITATSAAITVRNPATHFAVSAPGNATAGSGFSFTVTALDLNNAATLAYNGTLRFASSDSLAVLPANTTLTNGAGTFTVTLKTAATQTLTAADAAITTINGTSNSLTVGAAAATHMAVSAPPGATAGNSFNITVAVLDQFNNTTPGYAGTVRFTSTDTQAVLPPNATLTSGAGTFNVTLKTAGNRSITAADTLSAITASTSTVSVSPAAATHFAVSAPASATSGSAFTVTLTALDQYGNTANGYSGTLQLTSSDAQAGLPAISTLTSGSGAFSATLNTPGNQTLTATDNADSTVGGVSNTIAVYNPATHFAVTAPGVATAGSSISFTVTGLDANNVATPAYAGTVSLSSGDIQAVLPADATLISGVGTFTATLKTAGSQTFTATDRANSTIAGTSGAVTVIAAAVTHFTVTGNPAILSAGTAFNVSVTALDQFNNTGTAYSGSVRFTSNDTQAALPANSTLTGGVGTFSVTFKTAGNRTVTATELGGSSSGTSGTTTVTPAAAARFTITGLPASPTAGNGFNMTVRAIDAFNNTVTNFTGSVHFTSSDPLAVLQTDKTLTSGQGTFGVTLKTAGSQTLTAADAANSAVNGSGTTTVNAAAATRFSLAAPALTGAGNPFSVTVTARDTFGNIAANYTGTVRFTKTDAGAVVPANYTFVSAEHGVHTFTNAFTLVSAGAQTITAMDAATSSITGAATVNVGVTLSIPSNLTGGRGNITTVPLNVNLLSDPVNGNAGLSGGDFIVYYDPNLFTVADTDVRLGSIPTPASAWGLLANTSVPGQIVIGLSGTGNNNTTAGGSLVTVDFHVKSTAPIGAVSAIDLAADLSGGLPLTHVADQNAQDYVLTPPPLDGPDPNDGSITIVNQAPVASGDFYAVTERAVAGDPVLVVASPGVLANDTDPDGQPITAIKVSDPSHGLVAFNSDGSFTYTPDLGYHGADNFTYKASDGSLFSNTVTVNLNVTPRLSIPSNLSGVPGGTVVVPVNIDNPNPPGSGGLDAATLAVNYDPSVFTVDANDVQTGTVTSGWSLTTDINAAAGQIGIHLSSATPNTSVSAGSLALITLHIKSTTPGATSAINLAATNSANGGTVATSLHTAVGGLLDLRPAVTNAANDAGVDGAVTIVGATHFVVSAPANATAGGAFGVTVTALDQFNATAAGYSGTVHFTSSDSLVSLPADATLSGGVGTFNVSLKTVGTRTITATDTVNGVTGVSGGIAVSAAAATHFTVTAPASVTFGSAFNFTVIAKDDFNNTAAGYSGMVHFTSSDSQASLPADAVLSGGVGTLNATLKSSGSQTLTATDTAVTSILGTSNNISPAATHFVISVPAATTAGDAFVIMISAQDQFGVTTTGYAGTVHFSSSDAKAGLPADVTLNNGFGFFATILKTAGNQSLTAIDKVNSALSGTTSVIAVSPAAVNHFGFTVPATAATGVPFSFSVTALDPFNNVLTGYAGAVHFMSNDGAATVPADATLISGTGTFSATLRTVGSQLLLATDTITTSITGASGLITTRGLLVSAVTPTPLGFVASFNKAFDPSVVNLYDGVGTYGAADVTVIGPSGLVRGSLLLDPSNTSFTFIKTGVGTNGLFAGVLAAGNYTVTFRSAANGFKDQDGGLLDGNGDGVSGDNYVTTFTVGATSQPVLSVPDFARGPNSAVNIKVPQLNGSGMPITLTNAVGVTDVTFKLSYNPALLNITSTLSNTSGTFTLVGTPSGGVANFWFHSSTSLNGNVTLGQIVAQVPDSAASSYKAKELLHLSNIVLNGSITTVVNDDGVHVAAYPGDVSGDGLISPLDASLTSRVATIFDTGFAAYRLADPAIVGDLNGNSFTDSSDVTLINRTLAGITVTQLPPLPTGLTIVPTGPDPTLSLPTDLQAASGETVVVPVNLDTARPETSTGLMEAILALKYDPKVFTVSAQDVRLGTLPTSGSGWKLQAVVNAQTGEIGIDLFSPTPIVSTGAGSLVTLTLHVLSEAPAGVSGINLVRSVNPTGQRQYVTTASDAAGPYILHPTVTDEGWDAGVDGRVNVPATSTTVMYAGSASSPKFDKPSTLTMSALQPLFVEKLATGQHLVFDQIFADVAVASILSANPELTSADSLGDSTFEDLPSIGHDLVLASPKAEGSFWDAAMEDCFAKLGQAVNRRRKAPTHAEESGFAPIGDDFDLQT